MSDQRGTDGGEGRVEEAVARLRDRHLRTSDYVEVSCCAWDDADWPCDTAIVLDALESAITRAASAETQRDFYRAMWARRGDVVTGLTARLEAAERVVADLAEDIERRLVMGVGTISSQHVLRRLEAAVVHPPACRRSVPGRRTLLAHLATGAHHRPGFAAADGGGAW